MFRITNILNPLTGGATTTEHKWESGKPLSGYMDYNGECVVAHNGKIIELTLENIYPAKTDEYMVMPIPAGGDKQTWRLLGFSAMTIISFIPGWGPAVAWMGGNLVALFLKDKTKDQSVSQSYAWQHVSSPTAALGSAMPVIYGKARVRPTLKNRYITVEDDKQRLYALYSIASHKVDEISEAAARRFQPLSVFPAATYNRGDVVRTPLDGDEPGRTYRCTKDGTRLISYTDTNNWELWHGTASFIDDIIINGRAIEGYNVDVKWETRPGLPKQIVILGFDITYSNFVQDVTLFMDTPEINAKTARIRYPGPSSLVTWDEHNLLFQGVEYLIQADTKGFAPGHTYYIYYDPTVLSVRKYYISSPDTPPTASTAYIMFSFKGTTTGMADKTYYYLTNTPTSSNWFTPAITFTNTHNIEIMFEFPIGLFSVLRGETVVEATCRLFAQYREVINGVGVDKWINFDAGFTHPGNFYTKPYDDSELEAIVVKRKKQDIFNISLKARPDGDPLIYDKSYEIRVTASSPSIVKLVNVATIVYGEENADGSAPGFTYPGEPLLGIKALASGQLSSDIDVQVDVERSNVWVYNTRFITDRDGNPSDGRWVEGAANNHAWAVYDLLAQGHPDHPAYPSAGNEDAEAIYGCGIDKDRLDYESFRTWSEHTNGTDEGELGYELNIVFDTFITVWDAILRICQEGRGMVYPVGTKIFAFTDKATDVTQVFTVGNIHLDTFVQKYMESSQKINMVEVTYYDQNRNYEKTILAARTADWDSSTQLNVPAAITLYGTTTYEQAWSIARFILLGNELLNNIITFGVDIDALAAQAGDVVEVQHDILTTGEGGRIKEVQHNQARNGSFEDGVVGPKTGWISGFVEYWDLWGTAAAAERRWSTDQSKYGSYSYYHRATITNAGIAQVFTVKPDTTYTLSCWMYMTNYLLSTSSTRIQTEAGNAYYSAYGVRSLANQWQRVSVTFTTDPEQTSATVWIGGRGGVYFDGLIMNTGSSAIDFMMGTMLTFDKTLSVGAGIHQLEISHADGTIERKNVNGGGDTDTITWTDRDGDYSVWGREWNYVPEVYEPYAFGVRGAQVKKYRITDISRTNELMRTLTLVQYDESLYNSYAPNDDTPEVPAGEISLAKIAPPSDTVELLANLLNIASNVQLQEVLSRNRITGEYESSIVVTWDTVAGDPRGSWEVWFRDVDASDVNWQGTWEAGIYAQGDKVELDGKTYISLVEDNITQPISR